MGRNAVGGVLLLVGFLTTAPAGAASPGSGPTRVSLSAQPHAGAKSWGFGVSMGGGLHLARAKARYDSWDIDGSGPRGPSFDSDATATSGAAMALTLGGRVGSRLLVGGAISLLIGVLPNRFGADGELRTPVGVGPELALLPKPTGGVFAFARGGIGHVNALAWWAEAGGGYAFLLRTQVLLGVGLQLSGFYSRWGEDGDFGAYTYKDQILQPAVVARFML